MCARPIAASAPLSNPAATPTGFGKVRFHSFTCTSMGLSHNIFGMEQTTCRAGSFCCLQAGWSPLLKLHTASLWPVSPSVTLSMRQVKHRSPEVEAWKPRYGRHESFEGRFIALVEQDSPTNHSPKCSQASELPEIYSLFDESHIEDSSKDASPYLSHCTSLLVAHDNF